MGGSMGEEQKHEMGPYTGPDRRAAHSEVRLTDATIDYLEERMTNAVRVGLKEALTEDTARMFWGAGVEMLQKEARDQAGRFVIGSLAALAKRVFIFMTLVGIVYALGGWSALAALAKTMFSHGGHT